MATATPRAPAARPVRPSADDFRTSATDLRPSGTEFRCEQCGHVLRVFGLGRHRVYFEPGNTRLDDPVMDGVCPQCGHVLPGKNGREQSPSGPHEQSDQKPEVISDDPRILS